MAESASIQHIDNEFIDRQCRSSVVDEKTDALQYVGLTLSSSSL